MENIDYDQEIEKKYHPENFSEDNDNDGELVAVNHMDEDIDEKLARMTF